MQKLDLPARLVELPRWVCWQKQPNEKDPTKPRKVPMRADGGGKASCNRPATWGTFQQAQATLARKKYDGLGFMLGDGIFGVDIDHCMNNGQLNELARDIMRRLPTYTEVSPSGTGLHLLALGTLPDGNRGRRKGALEVYAEGRYFTVTGQSIGGHTALCEGTDIVADIIREHMERPAPKAASTSVDILKLDDAKLTDKILKSAQGSAFSALWMGDASAHGGDASAADIALCNMLAFWTGKDAVRMDNLFRQSGLMRPKWDEVHGRATYGEITIEKAIADCKEVYTGKRPQAQPAAEGSPFYPFEQAYNAVEGFTCERGRVLVEKIVQGSGEIVTVPLSNFAPLIMEEITRDDGGEARKELRIEAIGETGKRFSSATVPARGFAGMGWVIEQLGTSANISAGQAKKDQLRYAIQAASRPKLRTIYSHTGWREVDGKLCFLYNGGAIGADGLTVEMEGNLASYSLAGAEASPLEAARASMAFLEVGTLRVTAPLLCAMYLAPLCHFMRVSGCAPAFIPFVAGATGTRKTTACTLALSHYGFFNPKQPPASFSDTANNIRRKAFLVKDAPLLVDDYHPNTDARNRARMCEAAQQLARAWGDLAERGRMQSDLTIKQSEPPRGLGIMSGEDVPDIGESGLARFYVIDVHQGDIRPGKALTAMQEQARRGMLAQAMRGYIEALRRDADGLPDVLRERFKAYRAKATRQLAGAHGRICEAVAWLSVGLDAMLGYWREAGALEDGDALRAQISSALMENAREQQRNMGGEKPVELFMNALRELRASGQAYIGGMDEIQPDGILLGVQESDKVYLLPQVVYGAVCKLMREQGSAFPIGKVQLWKRLNEQGLLIARITDKGEDLTPPKRFKGGQQRMLCMEAATVRGEEVQEALL